MIDKIKDFIEAIKFLIQFYHRHAGFVSFCYNEELAYMIIDKINSFETLDEFLTVFEGADMKRANSATVRKFKTLLRKENLMPEDESEFEDCVKFYSMPTFALITSWCKDKKKKDEIEAMHNYSLNSDDYNELKLAVLNGRASKINPKRALLVIQRILGIESEPEE